MKKAKRKNGFTLIELMIVIVIIGILATALLPVLVKSRYQSQLVSYEFNLRNLSTAAETYHTDKNEYPANLITDLVAEQFIRKAPVCPAGNTPYETEVSPDRKNYTVSCSGGKHYLVLPNVDEGFPKYNPATGVILK